MAYKRSHKKIHPKIVRAARDLMVSRPHECSGAVRRDLIRQFLVAGKQHYELTAEPVQNVTSDRHDLYGVRFLPPQAQVSDGLSCLQWDDAIFWFSSRFTVLGPFLGLRQWVQFERGNDHRPGACAPWANSLLFTVAPNVFRTKARSGQLLGVTPGDTFSDDDRALLVAHGALDESGFWTGASYDLAALREQERILRDQPLLDLIYEAGTASEAPVSPVEALETPERGIAPSHTAESLVDLNRDAIRRIARESGIRNVSSFTRDQLVARILDSVTVGAS